MKYLLFVSLFLCIISCESAEEKGEGDQTELSQDNSPKSLVTKGLPENDLAKKNIKGTVESREVWGYTALIKEGYVTNGELKGGLNVRYNNKGNEVESTFFNSKKEAIYTWKHSYDANDFLVKSIYKDPSVERILNYKNDQKGNPVECIELINGEKIKTISYFFNEDNLELETKEIFAKQEGGNNKRTHTYDAKGNRTETLVYDGSNALNLKQLFTYDDQGRETKCTIFNGDNSPSYKRSTTYDEQGNKIKSLAFDEKGQANGRDCFKYEYKYDEQSNWTTRIERDYNDVAQLFAEQKITYFK